MAKENNRKLINISNVLESLRTHQAEPDRAEFRNIFLGEHFLPKLRFICLPRLSYKCIIFLYKFKKNPAVTFRENLLAFKLMLADVQSNELQLDNCSCLSLFLSAYPSFTNKIRGERWFLFFFPVSWMSQLYAAVTYNF